MTRYLYITPSFGFICVYADFVSFVAHYSPDIDILFILCISVQMPLFLKI